MHDDAGHPFISSWINSESMSSQLKRSITKFCSGLGVPLVGFTPAKRWEVPPFEPWVPEEFFPASIVPETRTVIVRPVH